MHLISGMFLVSLYRKPDLKSPADPLRSPSHRQDNYRNFQSSIHARETSIAPRYLTLSRPIKSTRSPAHRKPFIVRRPWRGGGGGNPNTTMISPYPQIDIVLRGSQKLTKACPHGDMLLQTPSPSSTTGVLSSSVMAAPSPASSPASSPACH